MSLNTRKLSVPVMVFGVLAHVLSASAVTRYVDDDSTDPQSPYTNAAHAATTIQAAVDVSVSNDLILVSAGTYDTGTRVVDGSLKNRVVIDVPVTVRGVDGRDVTIIKGVGPAGNSAVRCVWMATNAVLDGFTLTNGHTRKAGDYVTEQSGGGIYAYAGYYYYDYSSSGAIITNCVISGCEGYLNGGGAMGGTFYDCLIEGNRARDRYRFNGDGGGAFCAVLYDCVVSDNHAEDEGGGLYYSSAYRCVIEGNDCPEGGGMYGGSATACVIRNNTGSFGGGTGWGTTLRNCLLYGNTATYGGGSRGYLYNCTVVSNSALYGGGIYRGFTYNCIIWGNTGSTTTNANWYSGTLSHTCTTPLPEGDGNITNAPEFVDMPGCDYRLLPSSPCLDAGKNDTVSTSMDLDGHNRIVRGIVDMGAYERQGTVDDMPLIPAGAFVMGATTNMGHESSSDEVPQHAVYISDFYMDRYEVTMDRWNTVVNWATNHGYTGMRPAITNAISAMPRAKGSDHPVVQLNWYDGVQWCNARSEMEGLKPCYTNADGTVWREYWPEVGYVYACDWSANGYRLPTEAEWEKAARGGTPGHRFAWSDTDNIDHGRANYYAVPGSFAYDTNSTSGYHPDYTNGASPYTSPVGSFAPNGYGLYDMTGNASEWCWDWFNEVWYYSPAATNADTRGPATGSGAIPQRVLRGGAYSLNAYRGRVAFRDEERPYGYANFVGGLRPVRSSWHSTSNTAPVIAEGTSVSRTVVEGVDPIPYVWGLNATDADNDTLHWVVGSGNHGATVSAGRVGTSNTVVYTPASGFTGEDSVAVQVHDGHGGIDTIAVNLYIEPAEPTLTVVSEYGVADPAVGVYTNTHGDTVICRVSGHDVSDGTEYLCTGWVLDGQRATNGASSGSTTNMGLVTTRDATLTWQWEEAAYRLDIATNGGGTVTAASGWYDSGVTTVLTATASLYWPFSHWSGDTNGCGITGNTITVTMTQSRSIAANFAFEPPSGPLTRYVDDDSSNPQAPYTNVAHAATNIQDAVDVSFSNDLILVSAGVYDTGTRVVHGSMMNRLAVDVPVTVRGIGGVATTIIRGEGPLGDGAVRCVYLGTNAVLEGFTLTNGHTRAAGDFETEQNGGGIWCEPEAMVSNCIVGGCAAEVDGGGVFRGTLHDCTLVGNACADDGAGACESVLWRCLLRENDTEDEGGGLYGGIAMACRLLDNTSLGSAGGAMSATLRDCLVAGNTAQNSGGGTHSARLYSCTVAANFAPSGGGVYSGTMTNCIVWGNTGVLGANWEPSGFDEPPAHCCTTPEPSGEGHVAADPQFADSGNGNYRLTSGSPCIDAGTNAGVVSERDVDGLPRIVCRRVDIGAHEHVLSQDDYDGDGLSNDDERIAGTDVADPDSRLAFIDILATGVTELVWIGGTQARQFVEMKTNLVSTTEQWMVILTNEPPTSITNVLVLPDPAAPARFYRIRVEQE